MEWAGLEGTLEIIEFQFCCHGQSYSLVKELEYEANNEGLEHTPVLVCEERVVNRMVSMCHIV